MSKTVTAWFLGVMGYGFAVSMAIFEGKGVPGPWMRWACVSMGIACVVVASWVVRWHWSGI